MMRARWPSTNRPWTGASSALLSAALVSAIAAPGSAQTGAPLKGPELAAALTNKTFRVRTEQIPVGDPANPGGMQRRTDGGYAVIEMFLRPDSSLIFKCTNYMPGGISGPCGQTGGAGTRDAGVWSIKGDSFCYQFLTTRGGREQCFAALREGAQFRLLQSGGPPSTFNGELMEPK